MINMEFKKKDNCSQIFQGNEQRICAKANFNETLRIYTTI